MSISSNMGIINIVDSDLPKIVDIHMKSFPDSTMTKLGREVVSKYYEWQMNGPHRCSSIGCISDGYMIGFCFCGSF